MQWIVKILGSAMLLPPSMRPKVSNTVIQTLGTEPPMYNVRFNIGPALFSTTMTAEELAAAAWSLGEDIRFEGDFLPLVPFFDWHGDPPASFDELLEVTCLINLQKESFPDELITHDGEPGRYVWEEMEEWQAGAQALARKICDGGLPDKRQRTEE